MITQWAQALIELAIPLRCVCCAERGSAWCNSCYSTIEGRHSRPLRPQRKGLTVPCWATAPYADDVRRVLIFYKERGYRTLHKPLGHLLAHLIEQLPSVHKPLALVPIPARWGSWRTRGFDHVALLANTAAALLQHRGRNATHVPLLTTTGRGLDSVGLTATDRHVNAAKAFRVGSQRHVQRIAAERRTIVLIDDIITTGATLSAAAHILRHASASVAAAAVIAAT